MAKIISRNITQIVTEMNKAVTIAVKNASNRLLIKLQEYINEDFYNLYQPLYYDRTMSFYNSAVAKMLSGNSASIGIDDDYFNFEYKKSYTSQSANITKSDNVHWTGEDQINMAEAGFHGNVGIYRDGHFFSDFLDYCDKNALNILREELIKQGITLK